MPPPPPQQIWGENNGVDIIIAPEPPSRQPNRPEMSLRLQQKVQKKMDEGREQIKMEVCEEGVKIGGDGERKADTVTYRGRVIFLIREEDG